MITSPTSINLESASRRPREDGATEAPIDSTPSDSKLKFGSVSATTEPSSDQPRSGFHQFKIREPEPVLPIDRSPKERSISAVVLEVSEDSVALSCSFPGEQLSTRILLPRSLVPGDLAKYGTPVTLALNVNQGIRAPQILGRTYIRTDAKSSEEEEIDNWIGSL